MVSKTIFFVLLFATGLDLANLPAQDSGCMQRTIAVGVVDGAWNLVPNLNAADFRGKLRGHDVQILSAALDTSPRRIVVLLDASGSVMDSDRGWKTEVTAAESLIRLAPSQASIGQIGFSERSLDTQDFDQEPSALLTKLSALAKVCEEPRKFLRGTALYDAIAMAQGLLGVPKVGDVIYALTDGWDNKSQTKSRQVEDELLLRGVRLFGVAMDFDLSSRRARMPDEVGTNQFRSMVETTGGSLLTLPYAKTLWPYINIKAKTANDIVDLAFQRMYQQMGEFYRLNVRLPETVDKPTKWKLEVIDASGKPMRGVEVHSPQELMPCAKASL
jgi:hypothetical protein